MTNPIWLIKTRLALQQRTGHLTAAGITTAGSRGAYKGITDAFIRIGQSEGLRGYYKGFGPSLLLVSTGRVTCQVTELNLHYKIHKTDPKITLNQM